ncbi:MAG: hypothetical protein A2W93_07460 [Bacteroidetes bacterium GWF2_43_63]|nr:MAG: hypothetical protein A2W94_02565 [Bacteroidetes bacterium GWE2_42_42]OFY52757.1 MAG: hypothetical protein A2W93_07460 [Bacteroidetes bacterium GWF2_43_63]HBG70043.1 hypothetical protein [Bacteroidales bacterium]HCB62351.1 hypothetical protein [Bacteroidales bacterium]HCY22462.1 hypothetical protein [Bacteroidales bacterium]
MYFFYNNRSSSHESSGFLWLRQFKNLIRRVEVLKCLRTLLVNASNADYKRAIYAYVTSVTQSFQEYTQRRTE